MSVQDNLPRTPGLNGVTQPLPDTPNTEPGDPGIFAPESIAQHQRDPADVQLQEIGHMAKRSVDYQFATLALLAGYAGMFRHVSQALGYLQPADLDAMPRLRDELSDAIDAAHRSLHAQQPVQREAAE